jgi:hypothetical protein
MNTMPIVLAFSTTFAASAGLQTPNIRADGSYEAQLLARGVCSPTFRHLVGDIQASDLIVYVSARRLDDRRLAGRLQFVAATATVRILRVLVGISVDRDAVIAALGHELQHAREIARVPGIRSGSDFGAHYRRHGVGSGMTDAYDTAEARQVQQAIRRELARTAECRTAKEVSSGRSREVDSGEPVRANPVYVRDGWPACCGKPV